MKKDQKYYGEVWFTDKEDEKRFCVLSFKDDDLLLETNLHSTEQVYKELEIYGIFIGLGYLTFIDCVISYSNSGITEARIYRPKYSFSSGTHFIEPENLVLKEFYVVNNALVKWVNYRTWYNHTEEKLIKKEFEDSYMITEKGISIGIEHYLQYSTSDRFQLIITNRCLVRFQLTDSISMLSAIKYYNQFQKVLQLISSGASKFEKFGFKCMECDEWKEFYYNDTKWSASTRTFVNTEYEAFKPSFGIILTAAFSNESFQFCLDKLLENFLGKHTSHNKRFINSIAAYEAFCKLYSDDREKKSNLKKDISKNEAVFKKIGEINNEEWKSFSQKIVRSRDFHIHSNIGNKDVFSEFDLLYISFLFDFVIAYLLLSELKVEQELLDKFVESGKSLYINGKRTNRILSAHPFNQE